MTGGEHGRWRSERTAHDQGGPRVTALLLLCALIATAACGARWSDEERGLRRQPGGGERRPSDDDDGGSDTADGLHGGRRHRRRHRRAATPADRPAGTSGGTTGGHRWGLAAPGPAQRRRTPPASPHDTITVGAINTHLRPAPRPRRDLGGGLAGLRRLPQRHRRRVRAPGRAEDRRRRLRERRGTARSSPTSARRSSASPAGWPSGDGGGVDIVDQREDPGGRHGHGRHVPGRRRRCSTSTRRSPNVNAQIGKYKYLYAAGRPDGRARVHRQRHRADAGRRSRRRRCRPSASRS